MLSDSIAEGNGVDGDGAKEIGPSVVPALGCPGDPDRRSLAMETAIENDGRVEHDWKARLHVRPTWMPRVATFQERAVAQAVEQIRPYTSVMTVLRVFRPAAAGCAQ